ncbi:SDR family NAD(P)-dependent oxidoreductase [Taklimakanibacter lacteus]|uniref:SDR family NAD(P)-dependent oxidoreductase n=1 Tax=Taklimakanibacter lacteus TaxID=2268456 RepID=UPI000E660334
MTLKDKRALVTGGASGIGRAIADAFAGEGARVTIADRAEVAGAGFEARRVDVAKEEDVIGLLSGMKQTGGIDILVNCAGILIEKPLLETSVVDFERLMDVNLKGVFLVGREALRLMVAQDRGGRVINIASELAYLGRENCSLYCASKGGVLSLTRSWAREFAPKILVNAIAPGPIDTPMLGIEMTSPETLAKESQNPLGRIGRPEEIAAAAVFLAGPGATFMTGQCVSPNGGAAMF